MPRVQCVCHKSSLVASELYLSQESVFAITYQPLFLRVCVENLRLE